MVNNAQKSAAEGGKNATPSAGRVFLPALEGLRAVAAIGIIVTHVAFQTGADTGSFINRAMGRFDFFVPVFFALSGFLLWRRHRHDRAWGTYLVKRVARIVPAYWATVLVVVLILPVGQGTSLKNTVVNLLLAEIYVPGALVGGLTHLWSLCVEMAFYLTLPLLAMAVGRAPVRIRIPLMVGLAGISIAWGWLPDTEINSQILPPAFTSWFMVGMLTAEAEAGLVAARHRRPDAYARVDRWLRIRPLWWVLAAAALIIASLPGYGPEGLVHPSPAEFARRVVAGTVFAAAILVPYALAPGSRFLQSSVMQALGRWSYGIFLWHVAVLSVVFPLLGIPLFQGHTAVVLVVTVVLTIPVAAISYALVEDPARRWVGKTWATKTAAMETTHNS